MDFAKTLGECACGAWQGFVAKDLTAGEPNLLFRADKSGKLYMKFV